MLAQALIFAVFLFSTALSSSLPIEVILSCSKFNSLQTNSRLKATCKLFNQSVNLLDSTFEGKAEGNSEEKIERLINLLESDLKIGKPYARYIHLKDSLMEKTGMIARDGLVEVQWSRN